VACNNRGVGGARLDCPETGGVGACAGNVTLKTVEKVLPAGKRKKVTLAKAKFSVPAGDVKKVKLDLSKKAFKLVKQNPAARKAIATLKGTNLTTVRKKLKIKLPS